MKNSKHIRIVWFSQNNNDFISLILPFYLISDLSEVREYAKYPDGYQRTPNRSHYLKVKSYISSNKDDFKFPTSIILGVDEDSLLFDYLHSDNCGDFIDFSHLKNEKIFRIVDGQHRVEGLKLAMKDDDNIKNFPLHVIVIVSKTNRRSIELEIFTQINSTAKRISTDLAELAKHSYQIKESKVLEKDAVMFISMEAAYKLKEKGENSVWNSAIKFDIHSEISLGIVGVTMFCESIKAVVEGYIDKALIKQYISNGQKDNLILYCQKESSKIADMLDRVWSEIIYEKWTYCFPPTVMKNEFAELVDVYYSKGHYIQNTLGVKVLNVILGECITKYGVGDKAIRQYEKLIENSLITAKDWSKGGPFAGLSSESGFAKVRKIVKNELSLQNI